MAGAVALLLGAGGSIFGASEVGLRALKAKYHRPAQIPYPKDDPYSLAKHELGRTLFFDPILSGSKVRSCATCHNPGLSWADGQPRALGEKQQQLASGLRTPTLLDVAWTPKPGWDGHFSSLEGVAFGPITAPDNMNLPEKTLIERLSAIPGYVSAFDAAFGKGDITRLKIEQALATFERSIVSKEAPFDRWLACDQARFCPFQRQGQLRGLSQRLGFHRRVVSRHRRRAEQRHRPRPPVPVVGQTAIRVQDADLARRGAPRSVHA